MLRRLTVCATLLVLSADLPGQDAGPWSEGTLRERSQGFQSADVLEQLAQIAELVENRPQCLPALRVAIHGDHQEYMLKVAALLDQLAASRWLLREEAEQQLIETGARAIALIEARARSGRTLEERIRCERIRRAIAARGTEDIQREIRFLRGWVRAAQYFPEDAELASSLVSAMGHTDPAVVLGAVRSLGSVATLSDSEPADAVIQALGKDVDENLRRTLLASLARIPGEAPVTHLAQLLVSGSLADHEAALVLRELRGRPEWKALAAGVAAELAPDLRSVIALQPSAADASSDPLPVRITLPGQQVILKPFLGLRGDAVLLGEVVPGLPEAEIPLSEIDALEFTEVESTPQESARMFLTQGSLLTGALREVGDRLSFDSPVFGVVEVSRGDVQGIAVDPELDRLVGASSTADRLRRTDGSFLEGRLTFAGGAYRVDGEDGTSVSVPAAEVSGLLLQRPAPGEVTAARYTRIDLANGDRLLGYLAFLDATQVGVAVPGIGSVALPLGQVRRIEFGVGGGALWGFTLVADYSENKIIELDDRGRQVFTLEEVFGAWDVECLGNGNLIVTAFPMNEVSEVTREGDKVWIFNDLKNPYDADRLANGNTLIADTYGERVVEVDRDGAVVWQFAEGIKPYDVDRLANGNTLIADDQGDRVIEVDSEGKTVWSIEDLPSVHDADRLPNGNTLITLRMDHRVIEVDASRNVVFELSDLSSPSDADRLPNGNTLVAEAGRVREFDRQGRVVWEREVAWAVEVNRY